MNAELDLIEATAALGRLALGANYAHDVRLLRLTLERLKALSTPPADDVREALAKAWDEGVRTAGAYGHEDTWTHDMTPYTENPYRKEVRS